MKKKITIIILIILIIVLYIVGKTIYYLSYETTEFFNRDHYRAEEYYSSDKKKTLMKHYYNDVNDIDKKHRINEENKEEVEKYIKNTIDEITSSNDISIEFDSVTLDDYYHFVNKSDDYIILEYYDTSSNVGYYIYNEK